MQDCLQGWSSQTLNGLVVPARVLKTGHQGWLSHQLSYKVRQPRLPSQPPTSHHEPADCSLSAQTPPLVSRDSHLPLGTVLYFACVLSQFPFFVTPWTVAHQALLSRGFSRQEYWSGLPFPSPGDLPNPGTKPVSPASPALAGRFFTRGTLEAHPVP